MENHESSQKTEHLVDGWIVKSKKNIRRSIIMYKIKLFFSLSNTPKAATSGAPSDPLLQLRSFYCAHDSNTIRMEYVRG